MDRPLLLIDIDGVISLSGFDPQRPPAGRFQLIEGIVHFLSATAAELLGELALEFELLWCSGWEEKADEYLPRVLGLPSGLHHLSFGARRPSRDPLARCHWKLAAIDGYAGVKRALAWIDDDFDESCHDWARTRGAPTKLVLTNPEVGITAEQARDLREWARSLPQRSAPKR